METLLQDLRFGLRMLRKSPGFTVVAVLTLALGIGANTAIFSLIDAVMLRSLPVRNVESLVMLQWQAHRFFVNGEYSSFGDCNGSRADGETLDCSFPLLVADEMRSQVNAFSDVVAFGGPAGLELRGNGPVSDASAEFVSSDYFSALGVKTIIGRTLGPADNSPSGAPAAVLSYAYWQKAFGADKPVLGKTIELNNVAFDIVGVAEPSFTDLVPGKTQDLWISVAMAPRLDVDWAKHIDGLGNWWLVVLAQLKPGVTLGQAQAAATVVFRNEMLHGASPAAGAEDDPEIVLVPAQAGLTGRRGAYSEQLYVLMVAVGLILLIACANIAGLLLSRGAARRREMAVRLALGAGCARIWRQLLTESVLLSVSGGLLGILFAYWGVHVIVALISGNSSRPFTFAVTPDGRILLFALGASILTGILFGFAPALRSARLDLTPSLKGISATAQDRPHRFNLGGALVISQVALSVVALIGAGLLVRTLENLRNMNPGFDPNNVLLFSVDPTFLHYKDAQGQNLYHELRERLAALPGVAYASYSSDALLSGGLWSGTAAIAGRPRESNVEVDMFAAGPDFLPTMRIPLLEGRWFTPGDFAVAAKLSALQKAVDSAANSPAPTKPSAQKSPAVEAWAHRPPLPAIVNREFVRQYLAGENPLGVGIDRGNGQSSGASNGAGTGGSETREWQIVGVIGDAKYSSQRRTIHPTIYVPFVDGGASFELRTAADPAALIPAVRSAVNKIDSNLEVSDLRTQITQMDQLLWRELLVARVSSFFGLLALALACIGLYGLLSYEVVRRTREIGIRMALGAQPENVLRLIVRQGVVLAFVGALVGIGVALGVTRYLGSLLYGVHTDDPATLIAVAGLLILVALTACYIPARRAMRMDPMVALRYE